MVLTEKWCLLSERVEGVCWVRKRFCKSTNLNLTKSSFYIWPLFVRKPLKHARTRLSHFLLRRIRYQVWDLQLRTYLWIRKPLTCLLDQTWRGIYTCKLLQYRRLLKRCKERGRDHWIPDNRSKLFMKEGWPCLRSKGVDFSLIIFWKLFDMKALDMRRHV